MAIEEILILCRESITCCELLITQKQLTPIFLKMPSQYSLKWVNISDKQLVSSRESGLVVHLLDTAINLLPKGFVCNLGNQYIVGGIEIFHLVKACKCSAIKVEQSLFTLR